LNIHKFFGIMIKVAKTPPLVTLHVTGGGVFAAFDSGAVS